jgi:type IV pilus assembly protein PilQ
VLMELHAENSALQASTISEVGFIFTSQEGTTELLVGDGETAVIGGLTVTSVTTANQGIPILVDLPVIGRLFGFRTSQEERRDLLILVTPHIIDDLSAGAGTNR